MAQGRLPRRSDAAATPSTRPRATTSKASACASGRSSSRCSARSTSSTGAGRGAGGAARNGSACTAPRRQLASRARYQAAALQTELLRLQQRLDENDAHRRRTEHARAELAAINAQLSRTVEEVQALQAALREQATRDPLTGLFNRRHLNDALPTLFALAQRER